MGSENSGERKEKRITGRCCGEQSGSHSSISSPISEAGDGPELSDDVKDSGSADIGKSIGDESDKNVRR